VNGGYLNLVGSSCSYNYAGTEAGCAYLQPQSIPAYIESIDTVISGNEVGLYESTNYGDCDSTAFYISSDSIATITCSCGANAGTETQYNKLSATPTYSTMACISETFMSNGCSDGGVGGCSDPCASSPCMNGGTCQPLDTDEFECSCPEVHIT